MENDNMPHMALWQTNAPQLCCMHTWGIQCERGGRCEFVLCVCVCVCVHVFAQACIQWYPCVCSDMGTECVNSVINCANGKRAERDDKIGTETQKGGED